MIVKLVFLLGIVTILVSLNHVAQALPVFCPIDYQFDLDRMVYNAGETVTLGVISPYGQDCLNNPTQITLQIYDYTQKSQEQPLFKETKQAIDRTQFNFTLPEPTPNYTPHRYLAKISFPIEKNVAATRERAFYAQDFTKIPSYDFQIWPYESEVPANVWHATVISKICPFFPPTDIGKKMKVNQQNQVIDSGSEILMRFYFSSPSGSQIITSETVSPNSDCTETWARGFILPNETGTWSVYSTAQWMQEGLIKELQSKTVNFLVKEPVTTEYKITKLISLDEIKESAYGNLDGVLYFSSFNWINNGNTIVFTTVEFPNITWTLDPNTRQLEKISGTEYQFKDRQATPNQLGDIEVYVPPGDKAPVGVIYLRTIDGTYEQVLHQGTWGPTSPAISPNGRYVVFGADPESQGFQGDGGVYLIELSKPIPEFDSLSILILTISLISVIGIFGTRFRKNL